jgi:hypothetical protein
MGNGSRVDFMPSEEFKRREQEYKRLGIHPVGQTLHLSVPFDPGYDRFVANVAYELRHYIVYRSDGGFFARGLVRAADEIQSIHKKFRQAGSSRPTGSRVRLDAQLFRRDRAAPELRWAMYIIFDTPDIVDGDPIEIAASPEITQRSENNYLRDILDKAKFVIGNPAWNPPNKWGSDRVRRMRDWVELADRMGVPNYLNLWCYHDRAIHLYLLPRDTRILSRQEMTAATNGRFPFDGNTGLPEYVPWRIYPFKLAAEECRHISDPDERTVKIGEQMRRAEKSISVQITELNQRVQTMGNAANLNPWQSWHGSSADATGADVSAFLKHFLTLLKDPKTLYAPYMKYSQSYTKLWAAY